MRRAGALLFSLLVLSGTTSAGWFDADTKALLESAKPLESDKDADVVVLAEEMDVDVDASHRRTIEYRLSYRIVTRDGLDSWSTVQAAWSPWFEEKPVVRARVVAPDGTALPLDPATLVERAAREASEAVFDDRRIIGAPLPSMAPGSIVEFSILTRETRPYFERGVASRFSVGNFVPVRRSRFHATAPSSLPLKVELVQLPGIEAQRRETEGRVEVTVEAASLPARPLPEPSSPPDTIWLPYVAYSTGASWQDVASSYAAALDGKLKGASLDGSVKAAAHGATTREAKIAALTSWLHEKVRYTGVEFGEGALVPASPGETVARGYGDCKDKSLLLIALLRRAGLDADLALLLTGPDPDLESGLPGIGRFDHAIVRVAGTPPVWIDATDDAARPGVLSSSVEGRLALVVNPSTSGLVSIPATTSSDNREELTREFFFAERGPARVVETTRVWGLRDRDLRADHLAGDPGEIRKNIEKNGADSYRAKAVDRVEITDPLDLSRPFTVSLQASDAKVGMTYIDGAKLVFDGPGLLDKVEDQLPEESKETRVSDVWFLQPFVFDLEFVVHLPPGFAPTSLPEENDRAIGPAQLTTRSTQDADGTVRVRARVDSGKRRWTQADVASFRAARKDVANLVLNFELTAYAHLTAGRFKESLDEYRRLAALHPKEVLHVTQIADALLSMGLGDAARQTARRAVALDGSSAEAYRALGWTMLHDEFGRQFKEGCDLAEAERAYRKVKELDPSNALARSTLATVLEYNSSLVHQGRGARLEAAVLERRSLRDELDDHAYDANLLTDLALLGRYEDLKSVLPSAKSAANAQAMELVAAWGTGGMTAAQGRAQMMEVTDAKRRDLLAALGGFLVKQGQYADASSAFRAAAQGAPNAVAMRSAADWIASIKPSPAPAGEPSGPKETVAALLRAVVDGASAKDILSAAGFEDVDSPSFTGNFRSLGAMKRKLAGSGLSERIVIDAIDSFGTWDVEGDPAGWRVTFKMSALGQSTKSKFLLVEKDGKARIVDVGVPYRSSGYILDLIDRDQLDAAKRWLDWAAEDLTLEKGGDPLAGPAFPALWTKGNPADPGRMRIAAAALGVGYSAAARAVPILEAARATEEGKRSAALHALLFAAYEHLDRNEELAAVARQAIEIWPDSTLAFENQTNALLALKRWDELEKIANERLAKRDDVWAHRALCRISTARGPHDGWDQPFRRLLASPGVETGDFNNYAWAAVAIAHATDEDLDHAKRATADKATDWYYLNTLAAVYADLGRDAEAHEALVAGIEASGQPPAKGDWYVVGRMAENVGEIDAARRTYARSLTDGETSPTSVSAMVRRRQAALETVTKPAARKRGSR